MNQNHVITIDELEIMETQMKESPKLLQKSAGKISCCIFRVPPSLVEINKEAYQPQIVSIGPYHHGKKDLEMIQEHKWRFLNDMITRTGKQLFFFMNIIKSMENDIRECYSESIDCFSSNDLAKMMVLDGFFLIELFRKVGKLVPTQADDPIFKMGWIAPFLMKDFLRIENQIPFFVLQKLFQESNSNNRTLQSLILEFFNHIVQRPSEVLNKCENLDGKHLLDFFRESFIHSKKTSTIIPTNINKTNGCSLKLIQSASQLANAGVKFKENNATSFLDIEFHDGSLLIPQINMDEFIFIFLVNSMAFEQMYSHRSNDITAYLVSIGSLINTSNDVSLLSHNNIINNYLGTDTELAKSLNDVKKGVAFDINNHYLLDLYIEVNEHCKSRWNKEWAGFTRTYFESPWVAISAFAAFMLLSLAAIQTFYTVFPYYYKRD